MHPFILHKAINNIWFGIFILNSNAQDLSIKYIRNNTNYKTKLTFITIGGILDIYIMKGYSPSKVIQQYHNLIGLPQLPPYWALGWHQSRWGYSSAEQLLLIANQFSLNKIPLDGKK